MRYNPFMTPATSHIDTDALMSEILRQYESYGVASDAPKINNAYEFAKKAHTGVLRKSGDPYIVHPVSSVREVMPLEPDSITIIATLLHDTVSDGSATYEMIEKDF